MIIQYTILPRIQKMKEIANYYYSKKLFDDLIFTVPITILFQIFVLVNAFIN